MKVKNIKRRKYASKKRGLKIYTNWLMDFLKKCSDDHVGAFGAMSAFFILLSIFPFMIFLLTLTRYIPFSKDDIIVILTRMISFEEGSLIKSIVNEIYRKTGTTVSAISIMRHCGLLRVEFILSLLD